MGKKEITMTGTMTLKTAVSTIFLKKRVFRWIISKYTMLVPGHLYYQVFKSNGINYVYKLIKARERLFIAFQCDYSNAQGIFNLINGDHIKATIKAIEISDGLYVGDFPESLIFHNEGSYLTTGNLHIAFRFITSCSISQQYNPVGEIGTLSDFDELCHDMQTGFINSKDSDFQFKVSDIIIKAHKSVLHARSDFFKEFFAKDEQATEFLILDIPHGIMYEVLLHMYCGELCEISIECMVNVLKVAYLFKIPSLKERCIKYFEETDLWEVIEDVKFYEYQIED